MRAIRYCMAGSLLLASLGAMAQIVECVDANGKKTYAQTCQNEADKKRDIEVPKAPSKSDDGAWKAKEAEFEKRRQERLKAEASDAGKQQNDSRDAQNCADARRKLALLESGKQKTRVDPTTGQHLPDGDQLQAEIDELNSIIQRSCH